MVRGVLLFLAGFLVAAMVIRHPRPAEPDPWDGAANYYDGVLHEHVEPNDLN